MNKTKLTPERCQAAYDECKRELQVRERCYSKWVREGKISHTDATQRYQALSDAVAMLAEHPSVELASTQSDDWQPAVTGNNISRLPDPVQQCKAA